MKRNAMIRNFIVTGTAALAVTVAIFAQDAPAKKSTPTTAAKPSAAAVARGKEIFDKKCAVCHYADSDAKKIGPGLKGISHARHFHGEWQQSDRRLAEDVDRKWRFADAAV